MGLYKPIFSDTVTVVRSGIRTWNGLKPPVGVVRSCQVASESFDPFNRLAAALAKSQGRRASIGGFFFWPNRTPHESRGHKWGRSEENRDTVCRKARGQFPNNPWGWSNRQAQGHTVSNP